jgi:uncharacterized protein
MCEAILGGERAYVSGHPEIEQALMRLYAISGRKRYVELCGWLLGQRGRHQGRPTYGRIFQDHVPILEQRTIEGHAVCAAYLFNGVAQYAGATGHRGYGEASLSVWDDLVRHKMFLHGGSGTLSSRMEGYGEERSGLAPDDCFGESCAAVANFQWAHSLFDLTGDAAHLDIAERILYNAFAASLSLSGDRSFYTNVLQTGLPGSANGAILVSGSGPRESMRFGEYASSCCPPNIVKLINTIGGFLYSVDGRGVYVNHYAANRAQIDFGAGLELTQEATYPWSGEITITVSPITPTTFALRLRVPHWATTYKVAVNGQEAEIGARDGWLELKRHWQRGDQVELDLGMEVERVLMTDAPAGYENRAALRRGPVLYCLEEQDLRVSRPFDGTCGIPDPFPDSSLNSVYIPEGKRFEPEHRPRFLGGVTVLTGAVREVRMDEPEASLSATFIPYAVWGNRAPSEMRVCLGAHPAPPPLFLSQQMAGTPAAGQDWA